MNWLHGPQAKASPWCLTVSFVNPHDKEFFWGGTEFVKYNKMFPTDGAYQPFTYYSQVIDGMAHEPLVDDANIPLKSPRRYGYKRVPSNWQTPDELAAGGKPTTQAYVQLFTSAFWGGVSFDPNERNYGVDRNTHSERVARTTSPALSHTKRSTEKPTSPTTSS